MENTITKVAMDTHKKQHTIAYLSLETGETEVFTVKNTTKDIKKMDKKLSRQLGTEAPTALVKRPRDHCRAVEYTINAH